MSHHTYIFLKDVFHRFIALLLLIILIPVFIIIGLFVKLGSKGSVLYSQKRIGKQGKVFTFYKFRTMIVNAEKETGPVWAKDNDPRFTKIGKFLSRTNLDELPQLFNVLRGDMYFVGPRPERPYFVDIFSKKIKNYDDRSLVKPGLTGWAQVNGFVGNTSLEKRVGHDLYYIKHQSLLFDLHIVLRTFWMFLKNIFSASFS
jgi:putative colanic acid biosynthesis UDP-glucose lipid carrier transferase